MIPLGRDSLKTRRTLRVGDRDYDYFSLEAAGQAGLGDLSRLPCSLKILLENLLRFEDGSTVTVDDIEAIAHWLKDRRAGPEIGFRPARVLMQDFTGVPALADLAAMRAAMAALGGDPQRINPLIPVDLVIDHSVQVDRFGSNSAFRDNVAIEMKRNGERYAFLRWGQQAFENFRVVPPGTGICHQVNLEYLAQIVFGAEQDGRRLAYPDTLVGTDSHTTMINALSVLGWGVGGIEAEAAMLGQPISMVIPEVVGFRLSGALREGASATDLVLTVVQMLREKGVVGKFVEFFGPGLDELSLADRATVANMAPEYGATCGYFPVDSEAIAYLELTDRPPEQTALIEAYAKAQGLWREAEAPEPHFTDTVELDMATVEPSLAGPKRPQDKVLVSQAATEFEKAVVETFGIDAGVGAERMEDEGGAARQAGANQSSTRAAAPKADRELGHGDVVIAAITSCTNTSNPSVMVGAGLLARNAVKKGLEVKPWVKTSLAPGSKVVTDYLIRAGLQDDLDRLGFNLVGYGCTTCIGNSGPLSEPIESAIEEGDLVVCSVLSGNRNFEGRINAHVKANYLASPPLVVAYALAGSMRVDLADDPLGKGSDGKPVYLRDIWPSNAEIHETVQGAISKEMFRKRYADVFTGDEAWKRIETAKGLTYVWDEASTYIKLPPYFDGIATEPEPLRDIKGARPLAILGDSITTDHISPAGSIQRKSPAGAYLVSRGVERKDFNSYGSRRGNHEVMMRGTFANVRLKNEMAPETEGGFTRHMPDGEVMKLFDAAMKYKADGIPLVIVAGKEYGSGSSRDWAAKGVKILGVRAVIAESFERIHRSNLVGMGVLPLQFKEGTTRKTLKLEGGETFDILGLESGIRPGQDVTCRITREDGAAEEFPLTCRIATGVEAQYYLNGGILHYMLREMAKAA